MRTLLLIPHLMTPESEALRKNTQYHRTQNKKNELIPQRCPAGRFCFMGTLYKGL